MNLPMDINTAPFARPLAEIQSQQPQQQQQHVPHGCFSVDEKMTSRKDSTTSSLQQQQRRLWWQKSIIKRSLPAIEKEVQNLISSSPFLQQQYKVPSGCDSDIIIKQRNVDRGIAMFHRNEIITGQTLGKGGFSQVMEIVAFRLLPEITSQCTVEEQAVRQRYVETVHTPTGGNGDGNGTGMFRYCIKFLQEKLARKPDDFKLAASDLAIEAVTLSVLDHPNIISVRGLPIHNIQAYKSGQFDGYFIVMDRLRTTLSQRIEEWKTPHTNSDTNSTVTASSSSSSSSMLVREKMTCALQLALAIQHIHSKRLLYRDLKPQNIGFSLEMNEVQLFDFGLCRELPSSSSTTNSNTNYCEDDDAVYEMSGVGTRRYMAPEVVVLGTYNQKVDVYSWSMVFYELLTMTKPYATYSTDEHTTHVCYQHVRPALSSAYPYDIHAILQNSWNANIEQRYTIHEVCDYLQSSLLRIRDSENDMKCSSSSSELCVTNHDSLMSKEYDLPNSPTGVHDFPSASSSASVLMKQVTNESQSSDLSFAKAQKDTLHQRMSFLQNYNTPSGMVFDFINEASTGKDDQYNNSCCYSGSRLTRFHDSIDSLDLLPDVVAMGLLSPPPAPKRPPTTFVQVPDDIVRSFELSLSDNDDNGIVDDDNNVGPCSF